MDGLQFLIAALLDVIDHRLFAVHYNDIATEVTLSNRCCLIDCHFRLTWTER